MLLYFVISIPDAHKGIKHKLHYTKEDVQKAVKKVRTGQLSYGQVHKIYGIPKSRKQVTRSREIV